MDIMMYCESMDLELDQIFTECEAACNRAYARLLEEGLNPSFYKEAEGNVKSGGLFGFILSVLKSIKTLLSEGMKKMKSFLFGAEAGDNPNGKVESQKDPEKMMNFVTQYNGDAKNLLTKAMNGEIGVEEAKKFIDQKKATLGAIGGAVMGAASFLGISNKLEGKLASWRAEIEEAYDNAEKLNADGTTSTLTGVAARAIARSSNDANKQAIIKQTTKMLTDDIRDTNAKGIKFFEELFKTGYQQRVIKQKLVGQAQALTDPKARKAMEKHAKKEAKQDKKFIRGLGRLRKNIDKGTQSAEDIATNRRKNKAVIAEELNKTFTDQNNYVDTDDKSGKKRRVSKF